MGGWVGGWVEERKEEEVGVVVCGPDGLMREARDTVVGLQKSGRVVDLHEEVFYW